MDRRGSILVGLLWCLALLSLVVIGALHTSRMDLITVRHHSDRIQAHYLALAGIEKAKALLYQDAKERTRSARNHSGDLYDAPQHFRDVQLGRGTYGVIRAGRPEEGGGGVYGIADEESRLNVNYATAEELGKIQGMTRDVVAAIVDWRDEDNTPTAGGAEIEHYASFRPPSQPRNGPFQTLREVMMVRGVSREDFLGEDTHLTGLVDSEGSSSDGPGLGSDSLVSAIDTGWAGLLTVQSGVDNVSAAGQRRVDIQSADEAALTGVRGISQEIARAIIAYRGQNRFENLANLLDVTAPQRQSQPQAPQPGAPPGQETGAPPNANPSGPKVIDENLLLEIADDLTVGDNENLPGVININTAGVDVLACLTGVTRELAQAIVSRRASDGFFANTAWLLRVPGMTTDLFKQIAPRVTARSETFRILSEGRITSTGIRQRIQAVVHVGLNGTETLAYREDDL